MSAPKNVGITFELVGDQFPHGWFFNRFRVERVGKSTLVTLALVTDSAGAIATNAVVLGNADLQHNKERSMLFLQSAGDAPTDPRLGMGITSAPARIYPVNHFNLSRVDELAEIGFYRYSITTAANAVQEAAEKPNQKKAVHCYPVAMFRCDFSVQIALVKELYSP